MATKILRVGTLSYIGTVDIRTADDSVSSMVLKEIFETPYAIPEGPDNPQPLLLAEPLRLEPSTSQKPVYSAAVRKDVVFSDGTPLTAEIMRQSLVKDDDVRAKAVVEASGERIIFRLHEPNHTFPLFLSHTACGVVLQRGERLYGTGPFMFPEGKSAKELMQANPLVLVRNPKYRGSVALEELHFAVFPSAQGGTESLLKAAKEGAIDFTYSLTSVDAAELQGHPFIPSISTGNSTGMLIFNTQAQPLRDARIRRLLAKSIDRRQVASRTYARNPLAYVAPCMLPPIMGRDNREILAFNPREVTAELEREKLELPKKLSLQVLWSPRPYLPNPKDAAEVIKQNLAAAGVTVDVVVPKSRDEFLDRLKRGTFELSQAGWIADTPDPADFFEACLSSQSISGAAKVSSSSNNHAHYSNAEMDAALKAFRAAPTPENRTKIVDLLERDAPLLPLVHGQSVAVYSRRVRGFRGSAVSVGRMPFSKLDVSE